MSSFINISKLFTSVADRTVASLSTIYTNVDGIKANIEAISTQYLNENTLRNKRVLLKPNWVTHSKKTSDEFCLRTHDNFIVATLEVILKCKPAVVTIGDAPVQGCSWTQMLSATLMSETKRLSDSYNIPVVINDFRRRVFDPNQNEVNNEQNPLLDYIIFNLGKDSYLEPVVSGKGNRFRVTQYNPDGFIKYHGKGIHKYCITEALFKADIVISLPKIKTHQKTCITGALKNIVGFNGDKNFLPHHQLGGTGLGGDCYAGKSYLKYLAELAQDAANRNQGRIFYRFWLGISYLLWKLSFPKESDDLGAGWYGNDTTWRMVMDLNKIILYGKSDGSIADEQQRVLYSLCDAIIGGEGEGPLRPDPFPLGMISFSNDSELTDICFGKLMGLQEEFIPLLRSAMENLSKRKIKISLDGVETGFDQLEKYSVIPKLPKGWENYYNR